MPPNVEVFRPLERAALTKLALSSLDAEVTRFAAAKKGAPKPTSWIQLARTGFWRGHVSGEFSFDASVYAEIIKNFARNLNGRIPLDFEHASEAGYEGSIAQKGAPAQGWIIELRFTEEMLEGKCEWNPAQPGMQYVRDEAYMFLSPAVIFESIDRVTGRGIGAELTSAALTNRPFLDGMKPLAARHRPGASMAASPVSNNFNLRLGTKMNLDDLKARLTDLFPTTTIGTETGETSTPKVQISILEDAPVDDGGGDDDTEEMKATKAAAKKAKLDEDMAETEMRAKSAKAKDHRPSAMSTSGLSFAEISSELCEALNKMCGKWCAYIEAIYVGELVYNRDGEFFRIGYTINDSGEAVLVGTPIEVRRVYEPTNENEGASIMATATSAVKKMNLALGLSDEASEDALIKAFEKREAHAASLETQVTTLSSTVKAREDRLVACFSAMGLKADASDSEFAKRITELTADSAKLKEIEPEIKKFRDDLAIHEAKVAEGEVDWLIKNGQRYGVRVDESGRKSLQMHRKADPTDFALTYKAALDGMRNNDDPRLFSGVTSPGGSMGTTVNRQASQLGPDQGNTAFEAEVDREVTKATETGVKLSRNESSTRVNQRLFSGALNS